MVSNNEREKEGVDASREKKWSLTIIFYVIDTSRGLRTAELSEGMPYACVEG